MNNRKRLHPWSVRAGQLALEDLRRRAHEALLDLGLTEDEIATYYGSDLERLKSFDGFAEMRESKAS